MLLKKLFLNFYLGCAQLLSNRRGYGKKYKVINSTVNKIETNQVHELTSENLEEITNFFNS